MAYTGQKKRDYQNERNRKARQAWIESQGSKCATCGDVDGPFEVDHIDRDTKVTHSVWSWGQKRRDEELSKCQLLCQDCHWKKTGRENSEASGGRKHGVTKYHDGCRCETCVTINNEKKQAWRQARKDAGLPAP